MMLPLTYLTHDSVAEGVGFSQVLAYVEELGRRGLDVHLHSFEKGSPGSAAGRRLEAAGVRWTPHPFGAHGSRGGLARVLAGAQAVRGAQMVHARSDMAAASAMLAGVHKWVWDVRSLWSDQRIALGALIAGSLEHRVLQRVERSAARRSTGVVTLTEAVVPVLEQRHGVNLRGRSAVVPTCVDLDWFRPVPLPAGPPRLLLAGTLNNYYDVPLMARFVAVARRLSGAQLSVLSPPGSPWDDALATVASERASAAPREMPTFIARSSVGLSVCRADAGVSLTAAMPTKIAEFLAVGRPVVVNPGLGDADFLLQERGAGITLDDVSEEGLERSWKALAALLADPEMPLRCRALAEEHFSLTSGVSRLVSMYERLSLS